jgi:amino acid transporter
MPPPDFDYLTRLLGMAISPVILISACGMLLLTMSNRLARTIDRARQLHTESHAAKDRQIAIIMRRAKFIRSAILFTTLCMVLTALLILIVFYAAVLNFNAFAAIVVLFTASLLCLIAALVFFLRDIYLALHATQVELDSP